MASPLYVFVYHSDCEQLYRVNDLSLMFLLLVLFLLVWSDVEFSINLCDAPFSHVWIAHYPLAHEASFLGMNTIATNV